MLTSRRRVALAALLATALVPLIALLLRPELYSLAVSPKRRGVAAGKTIGASGSLKKIPRRHRDSKLSRLLKETIARYGDIPFVMRESFPVSNEDGDCIGWEETLITSVPVPESIKAIAGLVKGVSYIERMRAVDALGSDLTSAERSALLHFLHKRPKEDSLAPIDLNAVKNQAAVALTRQKPSVKEFPLHLIAMYYGRLDKTWRDYCIQFLGQCYGMIGDAETKTLARHTMFEACRDKKDIAGSAIVALEGLVGRPGFTRARIAETAYSLAADPETADIVKTPALQIAVKLHHPKAVGLAAAILKRSLAAAAEKHAMSGARTYGRSGTRELQNLPSVILRMSAIAALGLSRDHRHAALVEKFRRSSDIRLRTAAKAALAKL